MTPIASKNSAPHPGTLYLVPAPLDFGCATTISLENAMPAQTLRVAASLQHWICENSKSTRAYLKRVGEIYPLVCVVQEMRLVELPREVHKKGDHQGTFDARPLLQIALSGQDVGLVSEAGMPAIADPGSSVVRAAHEMGIPVVALVGPVSLMLALASSGLSGQNFAFVGYLPSTPAERAQKIRELESLALKSGQTQLFIETPYRNAAMLQTLLQTLQHSTRLATSSGLTLGTARNHSDTAKGWKRHAWTLDNDTPTVFALGR
jgi:16S rRNA (cytidine1402-2'-O)-methyltransferase